MFCLWNIGYFGPISIIQFTRYISFTRKVTHFITYETKGYLCNTTLSSTMRKPNKEKSYLTVASSCFKFRIFSVVSFSFYVFIIGFKSLKIFNNLSKSVRLQRTLNDFNRLSIYSISAVP